MLFLAGGLLEWLYTQDKELFIVNLYFDVCKTTRNGKGLLLLCILGVAAIKSEWICILLLAVLLSLLYLISLDVKFIKRIFIY